jgi:hypothetical protein
VFFISSTFGLNIFHYKTNLDRDCLVNFTVLRGLYSLILSDFNENDTHIMYSKLKLSLNNPHISAALKPINPLTDKRNNRSTQFVPSAARSTYCVDIATGSVLTVAQWTWQMHVFSGSIQIGRASGKYQFVRRFVLSCSFNVIQFTTQRKIR